MKLRPITGVLLFDKPVGPSSNAALQGVKRLYRAEKAGHTGSLDPLASGLLPICFGEATKLSTYVLSGDKGYRTIARLGIRTDTLDADGRLIAERPIGDLSAEQIDTALQAFRGDIDQVPPMYSALKRDGVALYELARQGVEIDRAPRRVRIDRLALVEWTPPFLVLDIDCSAGTYIRSLIDDLGEALGCGAHVHALRRTWAAPFDHPQMHDWAALESQTGNFAGLDARLIPIETLVRSMPQVAITEADLLPWGHGNPVTVNAAPITDVIAVMGPEGWLRGIARCTDGHTLKAVKVMKRTSA